MNTLENRIDEINTVMRVKRATQSRTIETLRGFWLSRERADLIWDSGFLMGLQAGIEHEQQAGEALIKNLREIPFPGMEKA